MVEGEEDIKLWVMIGIKLLVSQIIFDKSLCYIKAVLWLKNINFSSFNALRKIHVF